MEIEAFDGADLARAIEEERRLLVVEFWAEWCGHCRALLPVLETLARDLRRDIAVAKVDIDANREVALERQVEAAPTVLFFRDGELVDRVVGYAGRAALERRLHGLIAS